jgi:Kdo2-lipid IVA lauroyltransferase/acyltransferase
MGAIFYYIFYGFTWLLVQLPSTTIHRISDFTFFIIYHITHYRRDVVKTNLSNSFPEKSKEELKRIEILFYRHFCDLLFENLFLLHASRERALRRCKFNNLEIFDKFYAEGKSAILASGHYGNWELYALMGTRINHIPVGIFKPLTNKRFEKLINDARERFGGIPVAMNDTLRALISYKQSKTPILLGLIADQTPAKKDIRYWSTFLNQDTAVFLGVEKLAQKFDMPVIFCSMTKVRRGKYEVNFEILTEKPNELKPYELTEMHLRALEKLIRNKPEYWLWSHRRWKRKRSPENIDQQ